MDASSASGFEGLIESLGYWSGPALASLVFFQCAFLIGPVVPGNPLLLLAGVLAHRPGGSLGMTLAFLAGAAYLGGVVNFALGRRLGERWLRPEGNRWVRPEHLERTRGFFERHGSRAVAAGFFVPVVRSWMPFLAGAASVPWTTFLAASLTGAVAWVTLFVVAGYLAGTAPIVRESLPWIVIGLIVAVGFVGWRKARALRTSSSPETMAAPGE